MMKCKKFAVILLMLSVMSLAACQTMKPDSLTGCIAVKPVLMSIQTDDRDGISLDRDDTAALMIYIKQLQDCAGVG